MPWCRGAIPPDGRIAGLAWNPSFRILWAATNSETDTIYQLNPDTCGVLATLPHPSPEHSGAGLELDRDGDLWLVDGGSETVFLIETDVPAFRDVPWLSADPVRGSLAPRMAQQVSVTVDTRGLAPGVYHASLFVLSNSGSRPQLRVPVTLTVRA